MFLRAAFFLVVFLSCRTTGADPVVTPAPEVEKDILIHGFVSQGYLQTTNNNYLTPKSTEGSTEFAEAGLNFTKFLQQDLRVGIQMFARDLGRTGNYDAQLDWFYLDYRWQDWLGLRAGRVKIPFGLYNETNDIDSARNSVFLPQSIYSVTSRDFLLAQTGFEVYGNLNLDSAGSLEYRVYRGTISLETTNSPSSPVQVDTLDTPYVYGGRVLWSPPIEGLRLGGSYQKVKLDTNLFIRATNTKFTLDLPASMWVASVEYDKQDYTVAAEYSRWEMEIHSTNSMFASTSSTSERYYGMLSVRVNEWLHPGTYYSVTIPNIDLYGRQENIQNDLAVFFRFDVNSNWLFKLEGHYMDGTSGLSPTLNDNKPTSTLQRNWLLFMIKTTAHF